MGQIWETHNFPLDPIDSSCLPSRPHRNFSLEKKNYQNEWQDPKHTDYKHVTSHECSNHAPEQQHYVLRTAIVKVGPSLQTISQLKINKKNKKHDQHALTNAINDYHPWAISAAAPRPYIAQATRDPDECWRPTRCAKMFWAKCVNLSISENPCMFKKYRISPSWTKSWATRNCTSQLLGEFIRAEANHPLSARSCRWWLIPAEPGHWYSNLRLDKEKREHELMETANVTTMNQNVTNNVTK